MFTLEEPEIDHAIKLLFPGVVKKPMKLLKMNRTKMEDKKIKDRSGILSLALQLQDLLLLSQHIVLLQGNILTNILQVN